MKPSENPIYRFEDVEVDAVRGCLRRGDSERHLRQKAFHVLVYLLERRGQLVTKDELMSKIWNDVAVTDDALVQCVKEIRRVIGDDSHHPRFIKTVPKAGYRFIGAVSASAFEESEKIIQTEEITRVEFEFEDDETDVLFNSAFKQLNSDSFASAKLVKPASKAILLQPGEKPAQNRFRRFLPVIVIFCIIAASTYFVLFRSDQSQYAEVVLPHASGKKAVAVMFFENQSDSAELEWLREGLADMLITDLSRSEKLTVLNRGQLHLLLERSGHYSDKKIQLNEALDIARKTQAQVIVTGSLSKLGGKIRLDVSLLDAQSGQTLASESSVVERSEHILTAIDLLSMKLLAHLGASPEVKSNLSRVMTDNLEAYRFYSLGLEQAQAYHNKEAIELFAKAAALDPQFAMAHARLGYIFAVTWGLAERAKPFLERAFRLSDRLTEKDRLYITAWYAIANFDYAGAIAPLREIIAKYPAEVEAYQRLGHLLRGEGRYAEAIEIWKQGLVVDPEEQNIYNALGGIYSNLNRHEEAIAMMRRYVELAPEEPNAHDSLALIYQWAGRFDEALAEYNRALELKPDFEIAVVNRGNLFFQMGRYSDAIQQYEQYLRMAHSDMEREKGWGSLAWLYLKKGDLKKAEEAASKELQFGKQSSFGNSLMIALKKGDLKAAEKFKEKLTAQSPYTHRGARPPMRQFYFFLGSFELKNGKTEEAIRNFQEALRQVAPLGGMEMMEDCLADAFLELGKLDEAISEYERILRLNPNYAPARFHLALAFERKGQMADAGVHYRQFLETWKNSDKNIPEVSAARNFLGD